MFDPTAFDNMKVVFEGELYDRDLTGDIKIIDRDDAINLAKLNRSYQITFTNGLNSFVHCKIKIEAQLKNLAAELLSSVLDDSKAGIELEIIFELCHPNRDELYQHIESELTTLWGANRTITQTVRYQPLKATNLINNEVKIKFNRLILEDQMDELLAMIPYILDSCAILENIGNH